VLAPLADKNSFTTVTRLHDFPFSSGGLALSLFGIGKGFSSGSPLTGALGGAAGGALAGFAFGGPIGAAIGAIVGAIAGLFGGIFGRGKKKEQATRIAQEAQRAYREVILGFERFEIDFESAISGVTQIWEQAVGAWEQIGGKVGRRSISSQRVHFDRALEEINTLQKAREQRAQLVAGLPLPEFALGGFVNDFSRLINRADGSLLARLHRNESVLNEGATRILGRQSIEQLNAAGRGRSAQSFQAGGFTSPAAAGAGLNRPITVGPIHVHGVEGMDQETLAAIVTHRVVRVMERRQGR